MAVLTLDNQRQNDIHTYNTPIIKFGCLTLHSHRNVMITKEILPLTPLLLKILTNETDGNTMKVKTLFLQTRLISSLLYPLDLYIYLYLKLSINTV